MKNSKCMKDFVLFLELQNSLKFLPDLTCHLKFSIMFILIEMKASRKRFSSKLSKAITYVQFGLIQLDQFTVTGKNLHQAGMNK